MKVDPRFLTSSGPEIFTGNELLLKGALEAQGGVHLLGGYPGSPVAGFFDALMLVGDLLGENGIRAVMNNNEALAAAMLNGSQTIGCRGMIVMKSVGVHVAADALALGNLAGAHRDGGAVVVYGDDPWSDSTQVPADSRYISRHLFIPVIEPANPQEVKDFVDLSLKLSRESELYAGLVLTTNLADGGGTVQCRPNQYPSFNTNQKITLDTASINLDQRVLLPPKTWWQEEKLAPRLATAVAVARRLGINRISYASEKRRPLGFATSGMAHGYLVQVLWELGLLGEYPILKFGMTYPVDAEMVRQFAAQCERIVVIEERRGFLEEQIGEVILKDRQHARAAGRTEVWGKQFPAGLNGVPSTRGLHPSILMDLLRPLLKTLDAARVSAAVPPVGSAEADAEGTYIAEDVDLGPMPERVPSFCPGCPHRDSASLCLEIKKRFMDEQYMRRVHGCGAVDLVFHGDTGCYTMLMYPPNTPLMHDYSGMGLGGGTGAGTDPFITNKEVVFMGDGTFFHSGQIAIGQAIKFAQDITFIILDNSTTGMTGHQPTPGVDYDIVGNPTAVQDIEDVVNGMAAGGGEVAVVRADPERRRDYARLLERMFLAAGVKVVIADKECGITRMRRKRRTDWEIARRLGYLPRWQHMNINPEICRFCLACAEMTGCPGLKHVATDYGTKMDTDLTWCVNDGACQRIGACSSFERVTIKRKRPPRSKVPELGLDDIPEPQKRAAGDLWRCCLVGVGSQGVGTATSILVRAGHKEGYDVIFLDKKGLAIRNGAVLSQVVFNISKEPITAVIPRHKADMLLGIDILEAAKALQPGGKVCVGSPQHTAAVINTDKLSTIRGLMGQEDYDPAKLERFIRRHTRSEDYLARDISRICEKYLGSKQFANTMMLGFAFQKGLIPVSMHSMAWAIKDTIRAEFRKNLYAFNMGRKLVMREDLFSGPPRRSGWRHLLERRCGWTIRRFRRGRELAESLRDLAAGLIDAVGQLDEETKSALVVRLYDCIRWGGIDYARQYADAVAAVYSRDSAEEGFAASRAVVHNLASAMLIKDPVFVAELATGPEKLARDREKYNVNPANGDRITYRHLIAAELPLGRRKFRAELAAPSWALSGLKRMRFLRKLPGWSAGARRFLADYRQAVKEFLAAPGDEYRRLLPVLSSPQCMQCLSPRCEDPGCLLGSHIPRWVELACHRQWQQAFQELCAANNFPEFTAAVCPAPCQQACKKCFSGFAVQIKELERQIIERAFAEGWVQAQKAPRRTGKKVAVIGGGPAGLAAAQQLARAGHDVTVFEKDARPGGLLRYGIPAFRMDKRLIDRRIAQLEEESVVFRTGVQVGGDITPAGIRGQFDAVCLATGASQPRDLDVPGRRQEGVYFALDYLRQGNGRGEGLYVSDSPALSAKGKVVAVIGGGLTGEDCVQMALLQGAKKVHQFEILPESAVEGYAPVPRGGEVSRQWCVAAKDFPGDGRHIREVKAVRVRWLNSSRGLVMQELPESAFGVKVDMALLAMGYESNLDPSLAAEFGLATDEKGRIILDGHGGAEGVFVAGDLATGPSYVVSAINSGRRAAEKINGYLRG